MKIIVLQRKLIIAGILIVPFLSVGEISSLFSGQLVSQTQNLTGLFKISKDIVFILISFLGLFFWSEKNNEKIIIYFSLVSVFAIPAIISSLDNELISIASGLRWLLPIVLPILVLGAVDFIFFQVLSFYLFYLFILHFLFQILELFFASSWYGVSTFGLNLRNPGLFLIPNTGSFFTILVLYFILFLTKISSRKKVFFVFIASFSVLLTVSGTGYLVFLFIIILFYFDKKMLKWLFAILPFSFLLIYYSYYLVNARGYGYISESGGGRVKIFFDQFAKADFISHSFGYGTNTFVMFGNADILDSTFSSFIVNTGFLGFFIFISILIVFFSFSILRKDKALFVFLAICTAYCFTTIIPESYPANLIIALITAYFIKGYRKE